MRRVTQALGLLIACGVAPPVSGVPRPSSHYAPERVETSLFDLKPALNIYWNKLKDVTVHGNVFSKAGGFNLDGGGPRWLVVYPNQDEYETLEASIGIRGDFRKGTATFVVLGDGREIYRSPAMTPDSAPIKIQVPIKGYSGITLQSLRGREHTYAVWADPVFVKTAESAPRNPPPDSSTQLPNYRVELKQEDQKLLAEYVKAIETREVGTVATLLKENPRLRNARLTAKHEFDDADGTSTALMYAINKYENNRDELEANAFRETQARIILAILDAGDNVSIQNSKRHSALSFSYTRGLTVNLLKRGADPNVLNTNGDTILKPWLLDLGMVKLFLAKKGSANPPFKDGMPILVHVLTENRRISTTTITSLGPSTYVPIKDIQAIQTAFIDAGTDLNAVAKDGRCPLHYAVVDENPESALELATTLVDKGAKVNVADAFGITPLYRCAVRNRVELAKYLVGKGANLESRITKTSEDGTVKNGATPLHGAVDSNQFAMVRFLVERGAKLDAKDAKGLTPLAYAMNKELKPIELYLRSKGAGL